MNTPKYTFCGKTRLTSAMTGRALMRGGMTLEDTAIHMDVSSHILWGAIDYLETREFELGKPFPTEGDLDRDWIDLIIRCGGEMHLIWEEWICGASTEEIMQKFGSRYNLSHTEMEIALQLHDRKIAQRPAELIPALSYTRRQNIIRAERMANLAVPKVMTRERYMKARSKFRSIEREYLAEVAKTEDDQSL